MLSLGHRALLAQDMLVLGDSQHNCVFGHGIYVVRFLRCFVVQIAFKNDQQVCGNGICQSFALRWDGLVENLGKAHFRMGGMPRHAMSSPPSANLMKAGH